MELGLAASDVDRIAPTIPTLGLVDRCSSLFSLVAMTLVVRERESGTTLAWLVAANQILVGVGVDALTAGLLGLYFIAL